MSLEYKVRVKEIIPRNYNVKSFRLELPPGFKYQAGQFFLVALAADRQLKRYLSISSSPTEAGYLEFTKKITQSDFSQCLNKLDLNSQLIIQPALGRFVLDTSALKVAFLSGGIGITPIRSICKYVTDKNLNLDMVLVYSNRAVRDIVFQDDFAQMQEKSPHFRVAHVLCEAEPGFKCQVGRIDRGVISQEIPDYLERKFYLCGPLPMVEAMKNILTEELKLAREQIVTENFLGYAEGV